AGEGLEVDDGLAVVDAAERGDQDPADVHKIQEIVVLEHGRNCKASAEQHLREEKDKIDDSQVQYHQGDLEMIQKPVVHSGKVLKGLFEVYSGRKQGAKEGFLGMVIHEALEALHRQRMPFGAGHGAGDAFDVFGVDGIADFIFLVECAEQSAVRYDAGLPVLRRLAHESAGTIELAVAKQDGAGIAKIQVDVAFIDELIEDDEPFAGVGVHDEATRGSIELLAIIAPDLAGDQQHGIAGEPGLPVGGNDIGNILPRAHGPEGQ